VALLKELLLNTQARTLRGEGPRGLPPRSLAAAFQSLEIVLVLSMRSMKALLLDSLEDHWRVRLKASLRELATAQHLALENPSVTLMDMASMGPMKDHSRDSLYLSLRYLELVQHLVQNLAQNLPQSLALNLALE
jgi:hypothetical protein